MPDEGYVPLPRYWDHHRQDVATVLEIAIQLADALHYLIGQRVIDKDIKPSNLLIYPDTEQVQ